MLPHLYTIPKPLLWAKKGTTALLLVDGKLMSFREMQSLYLVPSSFEFRYWKLWHAIGTQFPEPVVLESDSIERPLTSDVIWQPLSSLYLYLTVVYDTKPTRSIKKWREHIPTLSEEVWEDWATSYLPSMIAAKDRFTQLKFLYRAYYTPQRLSRTYPKVNPGCTRCALENGTF